jgi:hypothetical protein
MVGSGPLRVIGPSRGFLAITKPTHAERLTATGMHLATILAPVLAPAIVWAVYRRSPFVVAHARRSLTETILVQALVIVVGGISLAYGIWSLYGQYQTDWKTFSIWPILARAAIGWILLGILEILNTVSALRQAFRAYSGEPI